VALAWSDLEGLRGGMKLTPGEPERFVRSDLIAGCITDWEDRPGCVTPGP
jgi:hypothetical protein